MARSRGPPEARSMAVSTGTIGTIGTTGGERLPHDIAARSVGLGGQEPTRLAAPSDEGSVLRLRPGGNRPPCPRGHRGKIWIGGRYSRWSTFHDRVRWRRVPADGTRRHDFFAPMPLRHPTERHPDGGFGPTLRASSRMYQPIARMEYRSRTSQLGSGTIRLGLRPSVIFGPRAVRSSQIRYRTIPTTA
jgi:hypothetical protein